MISRRTIVELALASIAPTLSLDAEAPSKTTASKPVFQHALPDLELKNWNVTAVEVNYPPGGASHAHQHAGFVLGYVLEGEVRFQLRGEPERIVRTGEMFFEPPGSVHQVSGNASETKPARLLALILAEQGAQLTRPA